MYISTADKRRQEPTTSPALVISNTSRSINTVQVLESPVQEATRTSSFITPDQGAQANLSIIGTNSATIGRSGSYVHRIQQRTPPEVDLSKFPRPLAPWEEATYGALVYGSSQYEPTRIVAAAKLVTHEPLSWDLEKCRSLTVVLLRPCRTGRASMANVMLMGWYDRVERRFTFRVSPVNSLRLFLP